MLEGSLRKWNPWWADIKLLSEFTGIQRTIKNTITRSISLPHIKDIIGIRRSGKTTILYQVVDYLITQGINPRNITFINFDDPDIHEASFEELIKTIETINPSISHLLLDEIQQKKGWERWLRTLYDTKKYTQIFISGSSASLLSQDIGRVLTGRHLTSSVYPFSFQEYLNYQGWDNYSSNYLEYNKNTLMHHLNSYLKNGGFPESVGHNEYQRKLILTNIYNDIISRDICARFNANHEIVQKISYHLLTNNGKEYSYRSVAAAADISIETAEKYIGFLKESFLILNLNVFSYKTKVQFKQNKKTYCIDTGLRNAVSFQISKDKGRLAENVVYVELKRRAQDIYYWKNGKVEIDFIIKEGLKPTQAIQVCWDITNPKTKQREVNGLLEALHNFSLKEGIIITEDTTLEEMYDTKKIIYVPLWKWLLSVEKQ